MGQAPYLAVRQYLVKDPNSGLVKRRTGWGTGDEGVECNATSASSNKLKSAKLNLSRRHVAYVR